MSDDLTHPPDNGQHPRLEWRDGVPVATRFDDPYYSLQDGLAETRHVFLDGNDLPGRFREGFGIAELGFGTGLNCLAAWRAWIGSGTVGPLTFTSFEAFPLAPHELARALAPFDAVADLADQLLVALAATPGQARLETLHLDIIEGDARQTLPGWDGIADAWFLDGFAPARNPELWEPELLTQVGRHTASGGTFATYTAAGDVRRALSAAGFDVERRPGFGRKRHMTVGRRR